MHKYKAFTLIELLVVIAIIAILAAILFPVFAQAKLAAKKTQALSNVKQVGTSLQMYIGDYDDVYCPGFDASSWTGTDLWCQKLQPYAKNVNIFTSPVDSKAGSVNAAVGSWAGILLSFACNSYYGDWVGSSFELRGPMSLGHQTSWLQGTPNPASAMTNFADTVVFTEKHSTDLMQMSDSQAKMGNLSGFYLNGILGGDRINNWPPQRIPNGLRSTTAKWPDGQDGAVSAHYTGQAVVVFLDGHAKSMKPIATNPNPTANPEKNMWDGKR